MNLTHFKELEEKVNALMLLVKEQGKDLNIRDQWHFYNMMKYRCQVTIDEIESPERN